MSTAACPRPGSSTTSGARTRWTGRASPGWYAPSAASRPRRGGGDLYREGAHPRRPAHGNFLGARPAVGAPGDRPSGHGSRGSNVTKNSDSWRGGGENGTTEHFIGRT